MTLEQFNKNWKGHIAPGWYGLAFDIPAVTEYLNNVFLDAVQMNRKFEIHQIKLKFGWPRFYVDGFTSDEASKIEESITKLINHQEEE